MRFPESKEDAYIEAIVVVQQKLELRRKIAQCAGHEAEEERGGCGHMGINKSALMIRRGNEMGTYGSQRSQKQA